MQIPGYKIIRKINSGGMASVYLAIQVSIGRTVALKIMKPELDQDPEFHLRFKREAEIVGQLSHPNVIPIYDIGRYNGLNFISMEYLPGGSVDERVLRGLSMSEVIEITLAIASALEHAHSRGYVHRDIKPENILFRADNTAVLTDFGIAKTLKTNLKMTQVGDVIGTPHYMSPEQAKGLDADGRSDLYSLGILCYEMLTGTRPFRSDTSLALAIQHINEPPPKLPIQYFIFQSIIDRLLAKKPEQRFQVARDLITELEDLKTLEQKQAQATDGNTKSFQLLKIIGHTLAQDIRLLAKRSAAIYNNAAIQLKLKPAQINSDRSAKIHSAETSINPIAATFDEAIPKPTFNKVWLALLLVIPLMLLGAWLFTKKSAHPSAQSQHVSLNKLQRERKADAESLITPQMLVVPDSHFSIGKYEITFNEYDYFAIATNRSLPEDNGWGRGDHPVINVSWGDAQAYVYWLSKTTGSRYRLATSSEWELAARGKTTSLYWWGDNPEDARTRANCRFGCRSLWSSMFDNKTALVGSYPPNDFGLHDTAGNVAEWVNDCSLPSASTKCTQRIIRGGSFRDKVSAISSPSSAALATNSHNDSTGFRVVKELDVTQTTERKANKDNNKEGGRNIFQRFIHKLRQ